MRKNKISSVLFFRAKSDECFTEKCISVPLKHKKYKQSLDENGLVTGVLITERNSFMLQLCRDQYLKFSAI